MVRSVRGCVFDGKLRFVVGRPSRWEPSQASGVGIVLRYTDDVRPVPQTSNTGVDYKVR